jgi:hypothetical protein
MKKDMLHPRKLESEVAKRLGDLSPGHIPRSHVEMG